jgi:two-component system, OmpR family, sensor histidine kinase VicK
MFSRADYNFIVKYGNLTPDGVAVFDLNSKKFVYLNRFFTHIFGVDEESLKEDASMIINSVVPDDLEFLDARYRELLSIGCISDTGFRIRDSDHNIHYLNAEVLWMEESYTFAIFVKDITLRHQHDEQVLKFTAQKDSLLDMLIHNLSGPLHLSKDVISILSSPPKGSDAEAARLISIIRKSTEQCIDIVNDFLREEHLASMNTFVKKTRFNVVEKISMMLDLVTEMNSDKKFTFDSPSSPVNLYSDPVKFCQVIQNLLSNSVKYTREGGKITVKVHENGGCKVEIADNGVGIPDHLRETLFHKPVKGTQGLKGEKSQGMGLYIVGQLVDMLGGELSYKSEESAGTEMTISFPTE